MTAKKAVPRLVREFEDEIEKHIPDSDMPLDDGIRRWVGILRKYGVETFESCEGGAGHAFPDPTIRFNGSMWAGYHAFSVAMEHGLPVLHLNFSYSVNGGQLSQPCWELVFHRKDGGAS